MPTHISNSTKETKQIAKKILENGLNSNCLALEGNLGAGKTQFVKGLAEKLGIKKPITSPTFVLLKPYKTENGKFKTLVHIDCYRLTSVEEVLELGLEEFLNDNKNLVVIEWPEKIKNYLPKDTRWIKFEHTKKENQRNIKINWI